ncbi:MAG: hypothetical protein H0V97_08710 [Actinobacteria bacterium]|nr:hypothetical protein [Actinomycetota bacterium]
MSWDPLPSTFEKARRREAYGRFARIVTGVHDRGLLPFDEVKDRLRFFEQTYIGIRPIPIKAIVGTAGRSNDFDRNFLPLRSELRERWTRVERTFPETFPPIVVYKVADSYFVVDGHHRVAISKQRKVDFIDAEVTELRTRYELPPGADIGEIIFREQEHLFMSESGLDRARPEAKVDFSQPTGFVELLELVQLHGFRQMMERGEVLSLEEIAADWYDSVYLPTIEEMRAERLADAFPRATEGDLFLRIWQRRRSILAGRDGVSLEETVRAMSGEEGGRFGVKARKAAKRLTSRPEDAAPARPGGSLPEEVPSKVDGHDEDA